VYLMTIRDLICFTLRSLAIDQSKLEGALHLLSGLAHSQNIQIRSSRHPQGECKADNYAVDRFNEANNTVYEFFCSYWHGGMVI